jgi:curved DNA-binding protein CbpA
VSSVPDAADRFKRVTAARETLLNASERARYDRLGHAAYVRSHGDRSLWTLDDGRTGGRGSSPAGR